MDQKSVDKSKFAVAYRKHQIFNEKLCFSQQND